MLLRYIFWVSILLSGSYSLTTAQSIYISENQLLSLTDEAIVYTAGSIINEGMLSNQGSIQLEQDWNNRQSYGGSGWLRLTGTDNQNFLHNNSAVSSLEISGGGAVTLAQNVSVTDSLSLLSGLVVTSSSSTILLEEGAEVINAGEDSYVAGPIQFQGTGYRYLPIGTSSAFLPITLEEVAGVNPLIEVEVFDDQTLVVSGERLESKTVSSYWAITNLAGSYDGSIVTLPITSSDNFMEIVGAVVVESDNLDGGFRNLGQDDHQGDNNGGLITSELAASKSIVTLGLTTEYVLENSVEIPSAFSPSASNPADRTVKLYAANLRSEGFSLTIFNRWGQVIYQTNDLSQAQNTGWDGLDGDTNQQLPPGVYPYVVRGIYDTGRAVEKTGSITLFR